MPFTDVFLVSSPGPGEKQAGRVSNSIPWNDSVINPRASLLVKSAPEAGGPGSVPGWEDPPEKEMEAHSSILAWRISQTRKPSGLQSMGLQRVGHNLATKPP